MSEWVASKCVFDCVFVTKNHLSIAYFTSSYISSGNRLAQQRTVNITHIRYFSLAHRYARTLTLWQPHANTTESKYHEMRLSFLSNLLLFAIRVFVLSLTISFCLLRKIDTQTIWLSNWFSHVGCVCACMGRLFLFFSFHYSSVGRTDAVSVLHTLYSLQPSRSGKPWKIIKHFSKFEHKWQAHGRGDICWKFVESTVEKLKFTANDWWKRYTQWRFEEIFLQICWNGIINEIA